MAKIDAAMCERLINGVAAHCAAPISAPAPAPNDFSGLSTAIGWGALVIMVVTLVAVVLGIVVAIRWGQSVVSEAKQEASEAAQEHVKSLLKTWLNDKAPALVRTHVELILAQSPATPAADAAADAMGEQA